MHVSRARVIMLNGHMQFHAGAGRNITFAVDGDGGIFFGDLNIRKLPSQVSRTLLCLFARCMLAF